MKVAQIGTGYWGRNHARVWKELKDEGVIDEVILVDVKKSAVKSIADNFSLPYLTSADDLPGDVDMVDIVAPTPLHFPLSKRFLEEGRDVFVEKPMTATSEEGETLVKIAEKSGKILMPGHLFRYHPALNRVREMISSGRFGRIFYIKTVRSAMRVPRKDMGVLLALAIHDVDAYTYILDKKPDALLCDASGHFWEGIEDIAFISLNYGETTGYIFESWLSPIGNKIREIYVAGENLSAKVDYLKPDVVELYDSSITRTNGDWALENEGMRSITVPYKEPLKEELLDFVRSSKTGKIPEANMYAGLEAVKIIEAAMKSAELGKRVQL